MSRKLLVLSFLLLFAASPVLADRKGGSFPRGKWWEMPELALALDLSPGQKDQLDELYSRYQEKTTQYRAFRDRHREKMEALFEMETIDEAAVWEAFDQAEKERLQFTRDRFEYLLSVRLILGRDRYLKLKESFERGHPGDRRD